MRSLEKVFYGNGMGYSSLRSESEFCVREIRNMSMRKRILVLSSIHLHNEEHEMELKTKTCFANGAWRAAGTHTHARCRCHGGVQASKEASLPPTQRGRSKQPGAQT
jgi:hypothetical protein